MRAIRVLICVVIAGCAAYALDRIIFDPLRCNASLKRVQARSITLLDIPLGPAVSHTVHDMLAELGPCTGSCPTDPDMYMTIAVADRILGRYEHAAAMYTEALKIDRRPELFFNRGVMRLQMGRRDLAMDDFVEACTFADLYANVIPDTGLANQVMARVNARLGRRAG
jgi:tetratricopeptide (TPR) repeat protein